MTKRLLTIVAIVAATAGAVAQNVTVSSAVGQNIGNFVSNNLVGDGVYIYNAQFNGVSGAVSSSYPQIGTFQANGYGALRMDNGVVLTTGNVSVAAGPNNSRSASSQVGNPYVDPEITAHGVLSNPHGCATLDFDFVCLSNSVSFTYCFGSEEYNEFVGTVYNDVFVFYLTGLDPESGEVVTRNIALIPGTVDDEHPEGIPVAINTVNNGSLGSSAFGGEVPEGCYLNYTQYFLDNDYTGISIAGVQYDGITSKMTASANVVPCESYHMHISVCNAGDGAYDSGVFLEGHSFSTPTSDIGLGQTQTERVEQGTTKEVPLTLGGTDYDTATVTVTLGGDAINGIDYRCLLDDGTPLNSGGQFGIGRDTSRITIVPLQTDLSTPKHIDIAASLSLCQAFPQLMTHDTLHYVLVAGQPPAPNGIAGADDNAVALYPNPATDRVRVVARSGILHIVVADAAGRRVIDRTADGSATDISLDTGKLLPGVYTLGITTADGQHASRTLVISKKQ